MKPITVHEAYERAKKLEALESPKTMRAFRLMVLMAIVALTMTFSLAHCEPEADWKPVGVGMGLLVAPIPLLPPDMDLGHAWEIEGFSYASTDILGRFMPKEYWFLSPICVGVADTIYRAGEGLNSDLIRRKWACDLLGITARVSLEIKF